jgi:hypothetical protein
MRTVTDRNIALSVLHPDFSPCLLSIEIFIAISMILRLKPNHKSKRIPFIFNDESTGSCICLRLDLYMSHVLLLCVSRIAFVHCSPTPSTTRSHTCAYVTRMKDVSRSFEMRHVIHDTRNISGQWPRCDVTKCAVRLTRLQRSYEISGN